MDERFVGSKILVVDNDPKTLKVLQLRLQNEGYQIIMAKDGPEALKRYKESQPDLVLVDVNMPGMSGLEVLKELKSEREELPVIVMTAYGSEEVAVDAMKRGANDYITKPFNSKEICQVIRENLERSLLMINRNRLLEELKASSGELVNRIEELERYNQELIESIRNKSKILAELESANLRLRELSIRDGLTKLYNHVYLQERLAEEFTRSQRYNSALSFVMADIDNFKKLNDTYGHQKGDEVLKKIAKLMMESIRGIDIAARYGGEEFVLILPQIDIEGAKMMAERLRKKVEIFFSNHNPGPLRVTISQGIASVPHPAIKTRSDLIQAADQALYEAKRKGKNRVEVMKGLD